MENSNPTKKKRTYGHGWTRRKKDPTKEPEGEIGNVESITGHKPVAEHYMYLFKVRWEGFTEEEDTWEPPAHFVESPSAIEALFEYIDKHIPEDDRPKLIDYVAARRGRLQAFTSRDSNILRESLEMVQ